MATIKKRLCFLSLSLGLVMVLSTSVNALAIRTPIEGATSLAYSLPVPEKWTALTAVAQSYAQVGRYTQALMIVESLKQLEQSTAAIRLLQEITVTLAKNRYYREALAVIKTTESPQEKFLAAEPLVLALIEAKEFELAEEALGLISNTFKKARLISNLSQAYTEARDYEKAQALLPEITTPEEAAPAQQKLAAALANTGSIEHSMYIAKTMAKGPQTDETWVIILSYIAQKGDFDQALGLIREISAPKLQEKALSVIAPHYVTYSRTSEALAIANSISSYKGLCISNIAAAMAEKGSLDQGIDLLAQGKNSLDLKALIKIGKIAIKEDKLDKAFQLADLLPKPEEKSELLKALSYEAGLSKAYHFALLMVKQVQPDTTKTDCLEQYLISFSTHQPPARLAKMLAEITPQEIQVRLASAVINNWLVTQKNKEILQFIAALPIKQTLWIKFAPQIGSEAIRKAYENSASMPLSERAPVLVSLSQLCYENGDKALGYSILSEANNRFSELDFPLKSKLTGPIAKLYVEYGYPITGLDLLFNLGGLDRILALAALPIPLFDTIDTQNKTYDLLQGLIQ